MDARIPAVHLQEVSRMKVLFIVLAAVLVLGVLALPIILVFMDPKGMLVHVRDMALIYSALFMCVGALLFIVMTGLIAFIAFTIRDNIVPALDKVKDTAQTVKGTATFVSESVVSPIIKVAGAASGAKAMVQTLMRRNPPKPKGSNGKKEENK
jgi:hypothetical protein